ncbi:MAG: hypothetical protein JWL73_2762 [Actinomycetia bacterium]|nr:hypothetical protein [Actinomycetes bacterium]
MDRPPAEQLDELGAVMLAGVTRAIPGWVERSVTRILDAWGRADADVRSRAVAEARAAGPEVAARVGSELAELFATPVAEQRTTPLEVVRRAVAEPTAILRRAGVGEIARDAFEERNRPDDVYGLVPHTLGDLGDPELAPLHLAWGVAKAARLRRGA